MKIKTTDIFVYLLFALLLWPIAELQTQLKDDIQLYLLLFGIVTLTSFLSKKRFITNTLFYMLLGFMLYMAIYKLGELLIIHFNLHHAYTEVNGVKHPVMSWTWLYAVFAGLLLSPFIVYLYHKFFKQNRKIEIAVTILFVLVTFVVMLIDVFD